MTKKKKENPIPSNRIEAMKGGWAVLINNRIKEIFVNRGAERKAKLRLAEMLED